MAEEKPPQLSDTMERCLIVLVGLARSDRAAGRDLRWHVYSYVADKELEVNGIRQGTIVALEERGLVESDASTIPAKARATDAGSRSATRWETDMTIVLYAIAAVFGVMTVPPLLHIVYLVRLGRREGWDAVARLSSKHRERQ